MNNPLYLISKVGDYCNFLNGIKGPFDVPVITIFIAFITSWNFRKGKDIMNLNLIQTLIGTYILGFSGSCFLNLILGEPFSCLFGNVIIYYTFFCNNITVFNNKRRIL